MTMNVRSYAGHSPQSAGPVPPRPPQPRKDDVVIEVLYCGVCHSDVHNVRNDYRKAYSE